MKIYVGHSNDFDFQFKLYKPLRVSELNQQHEIILPHEQSKEPFNSKAFFQKQTNRLFVAEVSLPSTGLGIELCWANMYGVPIICVYQKGAKVSRSIRVLTDAFIEYENERDLVAKLSYMITQFYVE